MSRIGKMPIVLPAGVSATINGHAVEIKGCLLYTSEVALLKRRRGNFRGASSKKFERKEKHNGTTES